MGEGGLSRWRVGWMGGLGGTGQTSGLVVFCCFTGGLGGAPAWHEGGAGGGPTPGTSPWGHLPEKNLGQGHSPKTSGRGRSNNPHRLLLGMPFSLGTGSAQFEPRPPFDYLNQRGARRHWTD